MTDTEIFKLIRDRALANGSRLIILGKHQECYACAMHDGNMCIIRKVLKDRTLETCRDTIDKMIFVTKADENKTMIHKWIEEDLAPLVATHE